MKRLNSNGAIGATLTGIVVVAGLIAPFWTPFDPLAIGYTDRLAAPGLAHWLGTDEFGRDVLSRLMAGATTSLRVSLLSVVSALLLGVMVGAAAGYLRGWTDRVLMTFNDVLLAFPGILLALGLLSIVGASERGIVLALGLAYAPSVARIVRGAVLSLRERDFVAASRIMGNGELYTICRHILPNCLAPLIVLTTSMFGWAVLAESSLSFLGLGVPPPAPTWGNMLAASRPFIAHSVWLALLPGLCISLTLLGINLLGDAVRDRLDPHMRGS
ncbi:ABC transporter permease [Paraburkholderia xenovorans]|uniref:ABC transporter permease n=1 Tax=Paraburkholderia xenovorans TaxID=36873 RepID=UPI0038B8A23D